jgi:hypothetical protein
LTLKRFAPALVLAAVIGALVVMLVGAGSGAAAPRPKLAKGFFGIAPQAGFTLEEAEYMKAGGIESVRVSLPWAGVQPHRHSKFDWSGFDATVTIATEAGLEVLPTLYGPPKWAVAKETTLPARTAAQRTGWTAFVKAAAKRYGPGGEFWKEHRKVGPGPAYQPPLRETPIKIWQIWNEENFFYFSYPVSAPLYGSLLTISSKAIKSVEPSAKVIIGGLFARPQVAGKRGQSAAGFLEALYRYPGIKNRFDGIDLHPYAVDAETLEEEVEEFHEVAAKANDRPSFYITEIGWGSQNDYQHDAYEQGRSGQVKQMRGSYAFLTANAGRLNLKGVYWFSWKDLKGSCDFCDSVGLFKESAKFKPKPAWRAFVQITGGRLRP